jgi:hypothetical protein
MKTAHTGCLSPCSRGEDEGEGFKRIRLGSTLTLPLPLSLQNGEAAQYARGGSKAFSQT